MRLPRIKTDYAGKAVFVGDEIFVWRKAALDCNTAEYEGVLFQLISGMKQSLIPGYHPTDGWVTICPVSKDKPCSFISVERTKLRKLSKRERTEKGIR